jgi:hypothetical protein
MLDNSSLYGLGKGAAQVIDTTSGAQQQFSQLLARQQQQRQLELKQLTDQQAQLKPGALRNQEELNDFLKYQNNWRQQSINAINEKDPYKKSLAQSQADMAYQQAQNFVARSKQAQQEDQGVYTNLADPTKRYQYAPGAVDQFAANRQLSVDNPKFVKNIGTTLQAAPDYDYFTKTTKGINDKLIGGATQQYSWDKPILDPTGKKLQPWTLGQTIDPMAENGLAHQIANQATADPKYLAALHARNPDIFAKVQTPDDLHVAINLAAAKEAQQGELYRKVGHGIEKPSETNAEKLALFKQEQDYRVAHPSYAQQNQQAPNTVQNYVSDAYKGNEQAGKAFAGLIPTAGMKPGEKPDFNIVNGEHVLTVPAKYDTKTLKQMEIDKQRYANNPQKNGGFLGFGGTPVPYEQSDQYKKNQAKYIPKEPAQTVTLPHDEVGYRAKMAEVANKTGLPIGAVNEAGGGHNKAIQQQLKSVKQSTTTPQDFNTKWSKLRSGETLVGPDGVTYTKK